MQIRGTNADIKIIAPTGRRFCAAKSTPGRGRLALIKGVFFLIFFWI